MSKASLTQESAENTKTERLAASDLKRIRGRYNLSQAEWAELTGLSLVSVNRWERGKGMQGKAADRYYRLLDHPHVFELLLDIRASSAMKKGRGTNR